MNRFLIIILYFLFISTNALTQTYYFINYQELWACDSKDEPVEKLVGFAYKFVLIIDEKDGVIRTSGSYSDTDYNIVSSSFDPSFNSLDYKVYSEIDKQAVFLIDIDDSVILYLFRTKDGRSQVMKYIYDQVVKK